MWRTCNVRERTVRKYSECNATVEAEMRLLDTVRLLDKFNNLRQKQGISIGKFKKLFDHQILISVGAGVPDREEPELAMVFLTKLDATRYGAMMSQLTNDASRGTPFPQTRHAA